MRLCGAIEAGGTKFLCAVGSDPARPERLERFDTAVNPQETIAHVVAYFERHGPVSALGVASFGPLDFERGAIARTPKLPWQDFPIRAALERALRVPVALETDVNAAALGEFSCGAAPGCPDFVYVTVGTGIGGGAMVNGRLVHGLMHSEMGHLPLRRHPGEPPSFRGLCPFHGDCLEGLASGPALRARWDLPADQLPASHPAWTLEAFYLAQMCFSLACTLSPRLILLGGGVMAQSHLFPRVREQLAALANHYLPLPEIMPPALPAPALQGALALAHSVLP